VSDGLAPEILGGAERNLGCLMVTMGNAEVLQNAINVHTRTKVKSQPFSKKVCVKGRHEGMARIRKKIGVHAK
jgi:hypothetical protein